MSSAAKLAKEGAGTDGSDALDELLLGDGARPLVELDHAAEERAEALLRPLLLAPRHHVPWVCTGTKKRRRLREFVSQREALRAGAPSICSGRETSGMPTIPGPGMSDRLGR